MSAVTDEVEHSQDDTTNTNDLDDDNTPTLQPPATTEENFYTDDKGRKVCNITDDGLVRKIMLKTNASGQSLSEHILGRVWINIKGSTADGTVFVDELFEEKELCLGKAQHSKAIDQALVTMKHDEHAIIEVDDMEKYGYPKSQCPAKCPSSNEKKEQFPIKFELFVIDSLPKQEESFEMTFIQQLEYADLLRQRGNQRYERGRFRTALSIYNRAIQCLDAMNDIDMQMPEELENASKCSKHDVDALKIKCYLNCSICHRRLKEHKECIDFSSKALSIDAHCLKALIRRGLSHYDCGEYELARKDFVVFARFAQDEKQQNLVRKYLTKVDQAKQREKEKQKKIYGGFLDKNSKKSKRVSLYDDKEDELGKDSKENTAGWMWSILMAIPNGIMYAVDECTKFCRKKNKSKSE